MNASGKRETCFLLILVGLSFMTTAMTGKKDSTTVRSNSNAKEIAINGKTPLKEMEKKAAVVSVSAGATKMIGSVGDGGAWTGVLSMRIIYAYEILESHERTLGKRAVRDRIEAKGFRFATYREALVYIPEMNGSIDRKYSANILLKAHSMPEGYIQENSIVIRSSRRGKRSVSVRRCDKRFDRHDCFLVVKDGSVGGIKK